MFRYLYHTNVVPGSWAAYGKMMLHAIMAIVIEKMAVFGFKEIGGLIDWLKKTSLARMALRIESIFVIIMVFSLATLFYLSVRSAIVLAAKFSQEKNEVSTSNTQIDVLRFYLALGSIVTITYLAYYV